MADAPESGVGGALTRKWHGLPVWAWAIIGAGIAYLAYEHFAGSSSSSTTTSTPAASGSQTATQPTIYDGGGSGGGYSGSGGATSSGTGTTAGTTSGTSASPPPTVSTSYSPTGVPGLLQQTVTNSSVAGSQATHTLNQTYDGYTYSIYKAGQGETLSQLAKQLYPSAPTSSSIGMLRKYNPALSTNPNQIVSGDSISLPATPKAPVLPTQQPGSAYFANGSGKNAGSSMSRKAS